MRCEIWLPLATLALGWAGGRSPKCSGTGALAVLVCLFVLVLGVVEAFDSLFGTQVTATIERECGEMPTVNPQITYTVPCDGRWSVDGRVHRAGSPACAPGTRASRSKGS